MGSTEVLLEDELMVLLCLNFVRYSGTDTPLQRHVSKAVALMLTLARPKGACMFNLELPESLKLGMNT